MVDLPSRKPCRKAIKEIFGFGGALNFQTSDTQYLTVQQAEHSKLPIVTSPKPVFQRDSLAPSPISNRTSSPDALHSLLAQSSPSRPTSPGPRLRSATPPNKLYLFYTEDDRRKCIEDIERRLRLAQREVDKVEKELLCVAKLPIIRFDEPLDLQPEETVVGNKRVAEVDVEQESASKRAKSSSTRTQARCSPTLMTPTRFKRTTDPKTPQREQENATGSGLGMSQSTPKGVNPASGMKPKPKVYGVRRKGEAVFHPSQDCWDMSLPMSDPDAIGLQTQINSVICHEYPGTPPRWLKYK